jgi:hypothetical protein
MEQTRTNKIVEWLSSATGISLSLSITLLALVAQLVLAGLTWFLPLEWYLLIGLGWAVGAVIQQRYQDPRWSKLVLAAVLNGVFFPVAMVLAWVRETQTI